MRNYFMLFILIAASACKTILLNSIFHDPTVETTSSIRQFQESNNFSTKNSLILKGDTSNALLNLTNCLTYGYLVFDSLGNRLCYNGQSSCGGLQFRQFLERNKYSFSSCNADTLSISNLLANTYDLNEKQIKVSDFPKSEFYVVAFWAKFFDGKRGYREQVEWMEDEISKDALNANRVTFIKVNVDLQESWGLIAGEQLELHVKKEKGKEQITFGKLPTKK